MSLVPICLYSNENYSFIRLPDKKIENDKTSYVCPRIPYLNFIDIYYGINPDIKPFPPSSDLICVKNNENKTEDVKVVYDPFDKDLKCSIRILGWLESTPNTLPLYIFKKGNFLLIKSHNSIPKDYTPYEIPVIHLLRKKTGFISNFGRCIPSIDSTETSSECVVKFILDSKYDGKYPNVISYLENNYSKSKRRDYIWILVICFLLLTVCFFIFFHIKMKIKN